MLTQAEMSVVFVLSEKISWGISFEITAGKKAKVYLRYA